MKIVRPLLGEQSGAWVVVRILKLELVQVQVGALSARSIIAAADSSSVGMGGLAVCVAWKSMQEEVSSGRGSECLLGQHFFGSVELGLLS